MAPRQPCAFAMSCISFPSKPCPGGHLVEARVDLFLARAELALLRHGLEQQRLLHAPTRVVPTLLAKLRDSRAQIRFREVARELLLDLLNLALELTLHQRGRHLECRARDQVVEQAAMERLVRRLLTLLAVSVSRILSRSASRFSRSSSMSFAKSSSSSGSSLRLIAVTVVLKTASAPASSSLP